jgi:hypothetical protein
VWVAPFYLWAIYLCGRNAWFIAGCVLGVGTMLKGQQLVVAPIFLLWPLMGWRLGAAGRFLLGFTLAVCLIVSPWIIGPHWKPIAFIALIGLLAPAAWLALWRWPIRGWRMPARWLRWSVPTLIALAMIASVPLFNGSMDWYEISIKYGADKFPELEVGGASTLTSILQNNFGYRSQTPIKWMHLDLHVGTRSYTYTGTISHLLIAIYAVVLLPCCWAMHRYHRAGDRRFLLAMAAPWILYFAVFPKMHERYLLWGALAACASVAVGSGPMLLAIFFSLASTVMSLYQMLARDGGKFLKEWSDTAGMTIYRIVHPTYPGLGWAILLGSAVWIWMTIAGAVTLPWRRLRSSEGVADCGSDGAAGGELRDESLLTSVTPVVPLPPTSAA